MGDEGEVSSDRNVEGLERQVEIFVLGSLELWGVIAGFGVKA